MTGKERRSASKFMSFVLRHHPDVIGLELDKNGWADTHALIEGMKQAKRSVTLEDLKDIVSSCDKQRFKFSDDYTKIRANHGHSVSVDVEMKQLKPPQVLYHGTTTRYLASIKSDGLLAKSRLHVHLSTDQDTAINVGQRHGKPVLLTIDAAKMHEDGFVFLQSVNGIWLTKHVPAMYLIADDDLQ